MRERSQSSVTELLIDSGLSKAKTYDTGGYTGDFGPEGKLAFLHEKELVLNK
jgi:hypothetical protein